MNNNTRATTWTQREKKGRTKHSQWLSNEIERKLQNWKTTRESSASGKWVWNCVLPQILVFLFACLVGSRVLTFRVWLQWEYFCLLLFDSSCILSIQCLPSLESSLLPPTCSSDTILIPWGKTVPSCLKKDLEALIPFSWGRERERERHDSKTCKRRAEMR
jgi:hypothetical protein